MLGDEMSAHHINTDIYIYVQWLEEYVLSIMYSQAKTLLARMGNEFDTVRDPRKVLNKWRKSISFDLSLSIQNECADVMKAYGYIPFNNREELLNISKPFFLK